MTIVVLEDSSKSFFGGGQKVTLDVIAATDGYVHLVIDCSDKSLFWKKIADSHIKAMRIDCPDKLYDFWKLFVNFLKIRNFLRQNSVDAGNTVFYAATKKSLLMAVLFKRLFGYRYIYHAHLIERGVVSIILRWLLQDADKVICVSEMVCKQIALKNMKLVYNFIKTDSDRHTKTIEGRVSFNVATISTLKKQKGVEYFIKSHTRLKRPDCFNFLVYGEGEQRQYLENIAKENVSFMGFSRDINVEYAFSIDLLIVPSIIPESFGMVILEAFSFGVPVVSTDIGMQARLVERSKAGLVVPAKSPLHIAEAIETIMGDGELYAEMSRRAILFSEGFSEARFQSEIKEVFQP